MDLSPIQAQKLQVQAAAPDHQGPPGGVQNDHTLVKALHLRHAGQGEPVSPVQSQLMGQLQGLLLVLKRHIQPSFPIPRFILCTAWTK